MELAVIHPLTAAWLEEHNYEYEHEYILPDYGRVDFHAVHRENGEVLLIEAKGERLGKVITQLAGYLIQMPDAAGAIAAIESAITDDARRIANKYHIQLIAFSDDTPIVLASKEIDLDAEFVSALRCLFFGAELMVRTINIESRSRFTSLFNEKFTNIVLDYVLSVLDTGVEYDNALDQTVQTMLIVNWGPWEVDRDYLFTWLWDNLHGKEWKMFK